jgi:hypothetical protein
MLILAKATATVSTRGARSRAPDQCESSDKATIVLFIAKLDTLHIGDWHMTTLRETHTFF